MKYLTWLAVLSFVSIACSADPKDPAMRWLETIDSGRYAESWDDAAPYFQMQVPREEWIKAVQSVREPLGEIVSRELISKSLHGSLPGVPDGNYVVSKFDSSYNNKQHAIDTVTLVQTQEQWKVVGYFIN